MSKTMEAVGMIVGGIALALVSGPVGMIALEGKVAAFHAMLGIGLTTALAGVGLALRPTPPIVGTANSIGFANGVSPRRVIYGQFQTAGVLTYASFPATQNLNTVNQYLHLVYTLTGHEISSFDALVIDGFVYNFGTDIQQDSSLYATPWQVHPVGSISPVDFYWEHMMFEFDCGKNANGAQPFPNLANADSAWTSACLQQGCAKVHVILRADSGWPALYPSGQIPNIQFLVTGKKLIDPRILTAWTANTAYPQFSYILDNNNFIWFQEVNGNGELATVSFNASGTGYSDGDVLTVVQGGASLGQVTYGHLLGLPIITITSPGQGYSNATGLSVTGGTGTGMTVNITAHNISPGSGSLRPNFEALSATPGATLGDGGAVWFNTGWSLGAVYNGNTVAPQLLGSVLTNDGWVPGGSYSSGDVNLLVIEAPTGYLQLLTGAGTATSTHPAFATTLGATTTDGTATWTCLGRSTHATRFANSALVVYDYLQDSDFGMGTPASAIDTSSVIAAANTCEDQLLTIWNADSTTVYENRYSCRGMFDHSSTRGNVLQALLASMAGYAIPPGDQWHIFAGGYITPTLGFTDSDLRGPIKGDFRLSKRDVANSIKGTYTPAYLPASPAAALSTQSVPGTWQSQSFPPYQANGLSHKPNYLNTEDGGQIIWQDAHFEFTTSVWTAQRLAKIQLMRLRFQETLTLPFKLTAFPLEAGDTFYFTHPRWNINSQVYEVVQASLVIDTSGKEPVLGVDVIARQTDPSIFNFTTPTSTSDYGEYSPYGVTGQFSGVE